MRDHADLHGSIENRAVRNCDIGAMDQCKDIWMNDAHNNCTFVTAIVKKRLDRIFRAACIIHGLCYSAFDTKRFDCDIWFYQNMWETCGKLSGDRRNCELAATVIYRTVKPFGWYYFKKSQKWIQIRCTAEVSGIFKVNPKIEGSGKGSGRFGSGLVSGFGSGSA